MTEDRLYLGWEIRRIRHAYKALAKMDRAGQLRALRYLADRLECEHAQGIEARSDETAQQAQPEGQEPGPKDAPNG